MIKRSSYIFLKNMLTFVSSLLFCPECCPPSQLTSLPWCSLTWLSCWPCQAPLWVTLPTQVFFELDKKQQTNLLLSSGCFFLCPIPSVLHERQLPEIAWTNMIISISGPVFTWPHPRTSCPRPVPRSLPGKVAPLTPQSYLRSIQILSPMYMNCRNRRHI